MSQKEDRINMLYDYAADRPEGFTNVDTFEEFGWDLAQFNKAARGLRLTLANDEITLTCDPPGDGGPWVYKLVGTFDDARPWARNRLDDAETRLETIEAVSAAIVNATDGRTREGKKARLIHSTTSYLREQLQLLNTDFSPADGEFPSVNGQYE